MNANFGTMAKPAVGSPVSCAWKQARNVLLRGAATCWGNAAMKNQVGGLGCGV